MVLYVSEQKGVQWEALRQSRSDLLEQDAGALKCSVGYIFMIEERGGGSEDLFCLS